MVDEHKGGIDIGGGRTKAERDIVGRDVNYNYGNASAPQRPRSSIPHQSYFFGRKDELEKIKDALSPETRSWGALIDGPGGIGKTALAIQAAIDAPDERFPIKIFLSAKVRELTPQGEQPLEDFQLSNFIALITEIARELGDDTIEKIPENERANAVRRLLADKNALIVIDNLETFDERERTRLYQFLGRLPEGSKAIVTSRRRTDIDARVVRLDRLDWNAARELITELATKNHHLARESEQERRRLYEITNGNPLLIKWLVGQLGRDKSQARTIAEAVTFIENAPKGNDPMEYIFGDLLDTFTESETAVLAALSHFTRPAEFKWIVDISGLAQTEAQTALEDLTDRALVISAENAQTYFLPPLAAAFIRHKRPEVIAKASERFTDNVFALLLENGYDKYDRFPILDADWDTVSLTLPLFITGNNAQLQEVCDALAKFMDFTGRWDERLWLNQQAEKRAVSEKDFYDAGTRAYQAGFIYVLRGEGANVLQCGYRVKHYWTSALTRDKAGVLRLLGLGHKLEKHYADAIEALQEALTLWRTMDQESMEIAIGLNDLANAEQASGDYEAAERDFRDGLRIFRKLNDHNGIAVITGQLATLAIRRADWFAAEVLAREALSLAENIGRIRTIGENSYHLARILKSRGQAAEGLPYAERAVEIYTRLQMPKELEKAQDLLLECETNAKKTETLL